MAGMTLIVRTSARLLFPFVILFGVYVVLYGHLTPGGGFPGGVIIATSVLMLILAYGVVEIQQRVGLAHAEILKSIGGVMIVLICLSGLFFGAFFLQNVLPTGTLGQLFSAGNLPLLYIGVGIKVTAGFLLIFYAMLQASGEKE